MGDRHAERKREQDVGHRGRKAGKTHQEVGRITHRFDREDRHILKDQVDKCWTEKA